ncbi:MAG: porin family protein [Alphaproteobacteria bacterium]|nr:porin family protein [Alphaproteobacteria bacterium]
MRQSYLASIGFASLAAALLLMTAGEAKARASGLYDFRNMMQPGYLPPAPPAYGQMPPPAPYPYQPPPAPPVAQAAPPPAPAPVPQVANARRGMPASEVAADYTTKGPYVRLDLGYSDSLSLKGNFDDDVRGSAAVQLGLGYRFNPWLRFDTAINYRGLYDRKISGSKIEVENLLVLANLYWDIWRFGGFTPYLMGGIGGAWNNLEDFNTSLGKVQGDSRIAFAWQIGGGISYDITRTLSLDLGYRYVDAGRIRSDNDGSAGLFDPSENDRLSGRLRSHDFMIGLRNQF